MEPPEITPDAIRPPGFQPPLDLWQPERNACLTCCVANVFYMAGLENEPDLAKLDRQLGRQPGQSVYESAAYLYLLKLGFQISTISPWDTQRYLLQGLSYIREFYADEWTDELEQFFTPQQVANRQQVVRQELTAFAAYGQQLQSKIATPTLEDIRNLLRQGVVCLAVEGSSSRAPHATLAYAISSNSIWLYKPNFQFAVDSTLDAWPLEAFESMWLPQEGIACFQLS